MNSPSIIYPSILTTMLFSVAGVTVSWAEPTVVALETTTMEEAKSPESLYQSARDLLKSNGGEADMRKGFERMLHAANQNHVPAIAGVAYLYNVGMGTEKNFTEALKWFRKAAEKGHLISQFNLGKTLIAEDTPLVVTGQDATARHKEGLDWLLKAASQGQNDARTVYGILLMNGDLGLKPDPASAVTKYLMPAADAGNSEAMNALGTLYQTGNGVPYDRAVAENYFRKAAMAGNTKAQANLGEHLDPSSKNESSRIEAFAWLFIAEEAKNAVAIKILQNKLPATSPDDVAVARIKAADIRKQIREQTK